MSTAWVRPLSGHGSFSCNPRNTVLLGLLLIVTTVALYYPVRNHQFLSLDDSGYVTNNPHVSKGLDWETLKWAFTTNAEANWHPLTWISHTVDFQLFQLDPAGHHIMNLALHTANVILLFVVLLRATGYAGRSFMVAALFALHPLNVESVAWVAERKNLLSMFFFLLALGAYRWYAREPRGSRYVAVALLYALGLMSKPQVITLPCVLLLWDYWPLGRMFPQAADLSSTRWLRAEIPTSSLSWLFLEKLPLFAVSAASAMITLHAQRIKGAVSNYSRSMLVANAVVSYARYLKKGMWPSHLAVFYPFPRNGVPLSQLLLSLLLLLTITVVAVQARQQRYLIVGWLWFLGTMVPMIGVVQVGAQAMADRYAYLPMIGIFIAITWGSAEWVMKKRLPPVVLPSVGTVVLLALTMVTHHQLDYWTDDLTLWTHSLRVTIGNYVAEDMVGAILLDQGNVGAAVQHLRTAAEIEPLEPLTYYYLGMYEEQLREPGAAISEFRKVVKITHTPELKSEALKRMGNDYRALGNEELARKCFEAASPAHR